MTTPTRRVFRIEQAGEPAIPYPDLTDALRLPPRTAEACIATSRDGVHLADALRCAPSQAAFIDSDGTCLCWRLTLAGEEVAVRDGWRVAS